MVCDHNVEARVENGCARCGLGPARGRGRSLEAFKGYIAMAGWAGSFLWREEQSLCWSWGSISGKRSKGESCWQRWPLVPAGTLGEREQHHTQNGESRGAHAGKARYSDVGNPPGTLKVQAMHRDLQGLQGKQELQQALSTWG